MNNTSTNNSTLPGDTILGLADRRTEIVIIVGVVILVIAILALMGWMQQRGLRRK